MTEGKIAETERRRHVQNAEANHRIEGFPPPGRLEQEIREAYIRGEIEAKDLVAVYKKRQQQHREATARKEEA